MVFFFRVEEISSLIVGTVISVFDRGFWWSLSLFCVFLLRGGSVSSRARVWVYVF